MKIHIKNGRLVDPKNGIDEARDIFIAAGKIAGIGNQPDGQPDHRRQRFDRLPGSG